MSEMKITDYVHACNGIFTDCDEQSRQFYMRRYSKDGQTVKWTFAFVDGTQESIPNDKRYEGYDMFVASGGWVELDKYHNQHALETVEHSITEACNLFSSMVHDGRTKLKDIVSKEQIDNIINCLCCALDAAEILSNEISGKNVPQTEEKLIGNFSGV